MKRKDILLILIPTFLFVITWTLFSVYYNFIDSTISESLDTQILPITPSFDTTTISSLKNRTQIDPIYSLNPAAISSAIDNNIASNSAQPVVTPTPSISNLTSNGSTTGGTLGQ